MRASTASIGISDSGAAGMNAPRSGAAFASRATCMDSTRTTCLVVATREIGNCERPEARLVRDSGIRAWDVDVEAASQVGEAHATAAPTDLASLSVSARYVHASAGYTLGVPWHPRAGVECDYGSGDSTAGDGRWTRFDTLFGNRRVDLAPTSIYGALGRENIETLGIRGTIAPASRVDAFAVFRWLGLAAAADAFASSGVRDPSGRSGRYAGRQLDARFRIWIMPERVRLEVGSTLLWRDRFLREAPNATGRAIRAFAYGDLTCSWSARRQDRSSTRRGSS